MTPLQFPAEPLSQIELNAFQARLEAEAKGHNCNLALGFYGYCPHRPDIRVQIRPDTTVPSQQSQLALAFIIEGGI